MEGKTRVLAACLLVLLLSLSVQPARVSGTSKFCTCFRDCYAHCRNSDHQPRVICKIRCGAKCFFHGEVYAPSALAGDDGGSCRDICLASLSCSTDGTTATGGDGDGPTDDDLVACLDGCTDYYGRLNGKHV